MLSKIDVADVPSCPVLETDALDGLLVGEVIRKFAFDHPVVQAARGDLRRYNKTKTQTAAFSSIFERGFFLWPLNLTFGSLNWCFRPTIRDYLEVDEKKEWGPRSPEIDAAFAHIIGRFGSITEAVQTNKIKLVNMHNNPVHPSLWRQPGIAIDLQTSDFYKVYLKPSDPYEVGSRPWLKDDPANVLLFRGSRVELPAAEPISMLAKAKVASPPLRTQKKRIPKKRLAVAKGLLKIGITTIEEIQSDGFKNVARRLIDAEFDFLKRHYAKKDDRATLNLEKLLNLLKQPELDAALDFIKTQHKLPSHTSPTL